MKKRRILNPFGVLLALLIITVFNACEKEKDDPTPEPPTNEVGTVLWTYGDFNVNPVPTGNTMIRTPAIGSDGTIYVSSAVGGMAAVWVEAKVHAINPDSTLKWVSPELDGFDVSDPVVGADGTIYVIGYTTVYAINPADGTFKWSYQPPANNNEQYQIYWLTLGNDGQIFFSHVASGVYTRRIYALNSDGQVIWKREVDWGASHLIVGIDGTLFAYWQANDYTKMFGAFDPANGTTIWSKTLESYPRSVAISPNGDIVISQASPDKLIKIDATTGEFIWQVDAFQGYPSISPDGSIYILSSDLYCYNSKGSLKWQTGPYHGVTGKIAIDSDGNAYVSATDHGSGNFQVYKPDGSLKWAMYQNMGTNLCSAIGSNNVIYVSWATNYPGSSILYAIQGDKPLASSGWPRDTGGNKNSRNINLH